MNRKLSRKKSNREHMIRNLAASLVLFESIETTAPKAKEVKRYVDKVLARNKEQSLIEKRNLVKIFFDKNASDKVFNELIPRYESRKSGFIRSFHLKNRLGDNAEMMRLELVDKKVFVDKKPEVEVKAKPETKKKSDVEVSVKSAKDKKTVEKK